MKLSLTERGAVLCALSEQVHLREVIQWEWRIRRFPHLQELTRRIIDFQPRHMRCNLVFWKDTGGLPLSLFDLESRFHAAFGYTWELVPEKARSVYM